MPIGQGGTHRRRDPQAAPNVRKEPSPAHGLTWCGHASESVACWVKVSTRPSWASRNAPNALLAHTIQTWARPRGAPACCALRIRTAQAQGPPPRAPAKPAVRGHSALLVAQSPAIVCSEARVPKGRSTVTSPASARSARAVLTTRPLAADALRVLLTHTTTQKVELIRCNTVP